MRWSADGGSLVFGRNEQSGDHLYRISADRGDLQRIDPHSDGDFAPAMSADGQRLAFTRFDDESAQIELYVAAADRSNAHPLTHTNRGAMEDDPAWSPDGRRIAFVRGDTDWGDLYVMDSDGSNVRRLTQSLTVPEHDPTWSPNGRRLAFETNYGDIDVIDVRTKDRKRLVRSVLGAPAWSPDGRSIAFAAGPHSLRIIGVASGRVRSLAARGPADDVAWSPDGRRIAYAARGNIYIVNIAGARSTQLTDCTTACPTNLRQP